MQLFPLQFQVTLYPRPRQFDWVALLTRFVQASDLGKSENAVLLPLGENAPPEVPRLLFSAPSHSIQFEATGLSWTMKWLELPTPIRDDWFCAEKRSLACRVLLAAVRDFEVKIGRVASLVSWGLSCDEPPALWIAKRFFRQELLVEPFNRPARVEVHSHKVYRFGSFEVNSWGRVKTESLLNPDALLPSPWIVSFQSDLNTLAGRPEDFNAEQMSEFYAAAWEQHTIVRGLYLGAV